MKLIMGLATALMMAAMFNRVEMVDYLLGQGANPKATDAQGATALAEASDVSPRVLRERVTSKGGTTAAALAVLNERDVAGAILQAVRAAKNRGAELGDLLDRE